MNMGKSMRSTQQHEDAADTIQFSVRKLSIPFKPLKRPLMISAVPLTASFVSSAPFAMASKGLAVS
jgi:hypothetical protein